VTLAGLEQLAVTGCGHVLGTDCDSTPVLKSRKMRKFMGRQDELAVIAAVRAVEAAALPKALGERCGLYLSVGFIPFEDMDLAMLVDASTAEGRFSMVELAAGRYRLNATRTGYLDGAYGSRGYGVRRTVLELEAGQRLRIEIAPQVRIYEPAARERYLRGEPIVTEYVR